MKREPGKESTIFLLEEDDETRRMLARSLRDDGYHVIVAVDEEDALERAGDSRLRADLILVNLVKKSADECLRVGRMIQDCLGQDELTPLVAMPEKYGKEVEGTDVNVGGDDWIMYLGEEPDQLRKLLSGIFSGAACQGLF